MDFFDFEQHVSGFVNGLSRVGVQDLLDTVGMGEEIWMVRSDLVVQRTNKEHMILVFHGKTSTAQSLLTINFGSSVASCFNSQFEVRQSPPRQNRTARVHDVRIIDHVRFVNANQISVSLRHGFRALAQLLDALDLFGFLIFIRKGIVVMAYVDIVVLASVPETFHKCIFFTKFVDFIDELVLSIHYTHTNTPAF